MRNDFEYPLFMLYLDLDELDEVFRRRWLWSHRRPAPARFRESDHLLEWRRPGERLGAAARRLVARRTGVEPRGPVRLLTHLRYLGYGFNPVSFFYCFDETGTRLETIVAEVNNTPWGEQHCYVLTEPMNEGRGGTKRYVFAKELHVSPFMDMCVRYDWRFTTPSRRLTVHMENVGAEGKFFDATLRLRRVPLGTWELNRRLVTHPAMTLQVMGRIYWQALRLWWKECPYVPHPSRGDASKEAVTR